MKSCLKCAAYLGCKNADKSHSYCCQQFKSRANYSPFDETKMVIADDWDIEQKFVEAVKNKSGLPIDTRIDDRDIKLFPNFVEFCISAHGLKQRPYIRQLSTGVILFGEWCNNCSDGDWLLKKIKVNAAYDTFIERVQLLDKGVCPKCKRTKSQMVLDDGMPFYNELAACVGQRAGKSYMVSLMYAYLIHIILKLQKPNEVYGVGSNNMFFMTLSATTFEQAKDLLYDPILSLLTTSPWFVEYHKMLDHYGGEEIYELKDTFTSYTHRNLTINPSGPDKRKMRGRTRLACSIDEIGWFDYTDSGDNKIKMNASQIYDALANSLFTVRSAATRLLKKGYNNIPTGFFLNISSPSNARDKIMELYNASQGPAAQFIYGLKAPTWEFNPNITRKDLDAAFRKDPISAEMNFGANPPLTDNPFIHSFQRIDKCFIGRVNPITIQYGKRKMSDGDYTRFAKILSMTRASRPSVMAIDAGYSNNAFALAVGSIDPKLNMYKLDLVLEIQPLPEMPLNYTRIMDDILIPIAEKRNVRLVVSDRWQNLKILSDFEAHFYNQDTEEFGVHTMQYSLKYADMLYIRQMMYDTEIVLPALQIPIKSVLDTIDYDNYPWCFAGDPVSHFAYQLLTVKDHKNTVTKGNGATDDILRASFLCLHMLMSDEFAELSAEDHEQQVAGLTIQSFAKLRLYSGGPATVASTHTASDGRPIGAYRIRMQ